MIDKATAKRQVMRLGGLRDFPKDNAEVLRDLISALELADSDKQADECISSFVDFADDQTRCPLAPMLRRWLYDRQEQRKQHTSGCQKCKGTGIEIVEVNGYTGARDCACRRAA
jgi:hypothetical protein